MPDVVFTTEGPNPSINGPFRTAGEVGSALALASRYNWEKTEQRPWISGFFSRHLATALGDYGVTFTHGDLHMRNILVEKFLIGPPSSESTGIEAAAEAKQRWSYRVSGVVDWESAGWYPSCWEYASAVARSHSENDWLECVDSIIKPYPLETSMFLLVLQDLQFLY